MPRIAIITPVFNAADYIAACVENVCAQGVAGLEHLVIDGGSTDGTVERLGELAARYPQLRYVSEKDDGQSDAMNKGVRLAAADIVGILNADDFYEKGAVAEALEFLERHPQIDFAAGDCRVIDENGAQISINRPSDLRLESLLLGWQFAEFPGNPSAYFYRKRVHAIAGAYEVGEHYAMDLAFLLACAAKAKMAYVPRLWGNFRLMPGTKTHDDVLSGEGAKRRTRLRAIWKARLSPLQRLRMHRIKLEKRTQQFARRLARAAAKRAMPRPAQAAHH